ncbi:MAG: zinc-dependent alcohol dehydrogenase family protein [Nocardioides sp.]|nr:zinc-dependent alcohol dehydrogenase family protein [Nocardioides sp.]
MRATTIHGVGDIRFTEVPDPVIKKPTDAIIKVTASCICGSDLWSYRGENGPISEPKTIGHECIGLVEEVGADVRDFKVGDFVLVPFDHCDNTCPACRAGYQSACENVTLTQSGQGEYALVGHADGTLVRLDGGAPDADLVPHLLSLTDVMATGWHAALMSGMSADTKGGTAVVVGDGAVGLCGVLAASTLGAERVVAMSRHEPRQALAKEFGTTDIVAERGEEGEARIAEITGGAGADYVLECVGNDQAMRTSLNVARAGATVGFVGVPHGIEVPIRTLFSRNVGLKGGMAPVRGYLPDLLARVLAGEIKPGRVFDKVLPVSESAEGYRAMDQREAIKVQLTY